MVGVASISRWGAVSSTAQDHGEPRIQTETVPCPGCSGNRFEPILTGSDHLTRLGGEFALVRCTRCDLVLTNPRPVLESLGYFYPSDYSPYEADELQRSNWWLRLLERSALRSYHGYPKQPAGLLTRLLGSLALRKFRSRRKRHEWFAYRQGGNLLDVGCGGGVFLERMRDFGWKVCGLELAADVARRVEQRTGITIHVGTLPHLNLAPQSFDAVTMWHVLEHVPNPRQLLASAAELLRPGGLLVIEVPNIDSETFEQFGNNWFGLELPRHFQHFNPKTLAGMLPSEAFRNVDIQQIGARSWIKRSAERALANGSTEYSNWLAKGKPFFTEQAARTESNDRADIIRLVAERV
jgi:2-polyprenyl-3-methyl-5-hydroxy-6-metoxy-1,4-benzoquinol methylase